MDIQTKGRAMHKVIAHLLVLVVLAAGGVAHAGTVTYVYTDPQGTPLAEADAAGHITATFDYAPYGSQALGTAPSGPGYTGHVNDPDTGLVYMQARYYDPQVGRFLSTDSVGASLGNPFSFNRYGYANNNPIVNMDPDGRCTGSHISNADDTCVSTGEPTTQAQSAKSLDARKVGNVFTHSSVSKLGGEAEPSAFPKETRSALRKFLGSSVGAAIGRQSIESGEKIGLEQLLPTSGYPRTFFTIGNSITYSLQWQKFLAESKFGREFAGAGLDVLFAHEVGHTLVAGRAFGYSPITSKPNVDEFNAVRYSENPYRRFLGLPLRTYYSGIPIPYP